MKDWGQVTGTDSRSMTYQRDEITLSSDLQTQHAEAGIGIVEGYTLDRASDRVASGR